MKTATTAKRTAPQKLTIFETTELMGMGKPEDPYREIKRYWVENLQGNFIEWFTSDVYDEQSKLYIQPYNQIKELPF